MPRLAFTFLPVALALVLRIVLNSESIGTNDALFWERYASSILQRGVIPTYENEPWFVHPPLIAELLAMFQSFSLFGGARFSILLKLPGLLLDVLVISVLVRRFSGRWWWGWAIALNPLALLLAGYHGNTDILCAALCFFSAHFVERERPVASALCLAAALNVSLLALVVVPVLLLAWSGQSRRRAFAVFALGALPLLWPVIAAPAAFARNLGAYTFVVWPWGVHLVTVGTRLSHPQVTSWMMEVAVPALRYCMLAAVVVVAVAQKRRGWSVWQASALAFSAALVLTPSFGVQFLAYPVAFLLMVDVRRGVIWSYVAGLFVLLTYVFYWTGTRPLLSLFDARMIGAGTQTVGFVCWALLAWGCVEIVRGVTPAIAPGAAPERIFGPAPRWTYAEFWERPGRRAWAWVAVTVVVVYVFVISAGTGIHWPMYMTYYDVLADGFRAGRLGSIVDPLPQLLATKDPYDLSASRFWIWDFSLYKGRYYIYWGPLPALVQAAGKWFLGVSRRVGDQYIAFLFFSAMSAAGVTLMQRLAARLFPTLPRGLVIAAALSFAFANPIPHLLASAGVYQTAIAAGQSLLLLGLVFAFHAVSDPTAPIARRNMLLAGVAWGFSVTCRVSLAPAVSLIILATAGLGTWWVTRNFRRFVSHTLLQAAPIAVAVAALLLYNKLRFDEWLEFGTTYQLSTMKLRLSWEYWPANLHAYWLRAPEINCAFPYVHQLRDLGLAALPSWVRFRPGYMAHEPVVGMLYALPCVYASPLVVGPAVNALRALVSRVRVSDAARERARIVTWCVFSFLVISTVTGLTEMGLFLATMRYLADVTNGLMLCAWFGLWSVYVAVRGDFGKRVVATVCWVLAGGTIGLGLLLGYQGYTFHFRKHNPELDARLVTALSFCKGEIPTPPGPPGVATAPPGVAAAPTVVKPAPARRVPARPARPKAAASSGAGARPARSTSAAQAAPSASTAIQPRPGTRPAPTTSARPAPSASPAVRPRH